MATLHLANPYMKGATALQKALVSAGLLPPEAVDDEYGPQTAGAVEVAKNRLGYPTAEIHHGHETADANLLAYLRGKKKLPPDYLERRKARLGTDDTGTSSFGERHEQARRAEVVAEFRWLIAHEPQINYERLRPVPLGVPRRTIPAGGITTDCSGAVILACKWAGVPDPSGQNYSGEGFTGSFVSHLTHITRPMVQPGDVIVLGPGTGEHACLVLAKKGTDLEVGSHGGTRGPLSIMLSVEAGYHQPPVTFLRLGL